MNLSPPSPPVSPERRANHASAEHSSPLRTLSKWSPLAFLLVAALILTPRFAPVVQMWLWALAKADLGASLVWGCARHADSELVVGALP